MAVLGKRKAPEPSISQEEANEIFRRHFEAQFQSLGPTPSSKTAGPNGGDEATDQRNGSDDDESEWGGLSGDDEDDNEDDLLEDKDGEESADAEERDASKVEVVDYSKSQTSKPVAMSKRELKAFMSSRPPDQTETSRSNSTTRTPSSSSSSQPEDAPSLLAQDLELRRLISESHLLSSPSLSVSSLHSPSSKEPKLFATGRVRQKTTDLRIQALGSKDSILTQKNMPMNVRKGIVAAAAARETKRRKEAKENGVILERESKPKGKGRRLNRTREIGVDMPGMGRLRGAELRLNDSDVKKIEGSRDVFGRSSGRRR